MKINVLVSVSSSGKVPIFLGVGVDLCMFGKCLTDTWLKCANGRKNQRSSSTARVPRSTFETSVFFCIFMFHLSSCLPEKSIAEIYC